MTQPRKHRHAEMIRRWLDDDSLEVEMEVGENAWQKDKNPTWDEDYEFRFKPKMIKCGGMELPEPMMVSPEIDTQYWVVDITQRRIVYVAIWKGTEYELILLQRGLCHTTQAAAEQHAKALIALTEVK